MSLGAVKSAIAEGARAARLLSAGTCLAAAALLTSTASAQAPAQVDLRLLHERVAFATVRIESPSGQSLGTGWLLRQHQSRPLIITNRHVLPSARGTYRIAYYAGSDRAPIVGTARVVYRAAEVDFGVLWPESEPPPTAQALALEAGDIMRGEDVVLGGNPHGLLFQTTEGVVTGHLPELDLTRECGFGRNCLVVDAASFAGSSGGPAINRAGRVIGMLWGGPGLPAGTSARGLPQWVQNPSFAFLIHVRVLEEEIARLRRSRRSADREE